MSVERGNIIDDVTFLYISTASGGTPILRKYSTSNLAREARVASKSGRSVFILTFSGVIFVLVIGTLKERETLLNNDPKKPGFLIMLIEI
jgi:hypothetical protein